MGYRARTCVHTLVGAPYTVCGVLSSPMRDSTRNDRVLPRTRHLKSAKIYMQVMHYTMSS
jgi:hypothetical protein